MTIFAGIDYDTKALHIVLSPEDLYEQPIYYQKILNGMDAFERARDVRDNMPSRGWWDDQGVVAIGIEEQNSGNPKMRVSVQKLKVIQGAILSCLPRETLVNPMAANEWRTAVGMKGNATKDDVEFWVRFSSPHSLTDFFSGRHWPQDAFDAYCLAVAVQKLTVPA